MLKGTVVGEVWASKKCAAMDPYSLKLVAVTSGEGAATGRVVVAVDTLDAERGRAVMVSFGSGARNVIRPGAGDNRDLLCDCAISQIIEGQRPD